VWQQESGRKRYPSLHGNVHLQGTGEWMGAVVNRGKQIAGGRKGQTAFKLEAVWHPIMAI